jgi:site-specific DNA recombinase
LQRLLADVADGKIDIIVVYKVDRLTRSLADFAKLVELFDQHNVSFVSVTQQFNTTTSMGRLTLNVLLSFAQFEREVTSERIRDKISASKRKGLWVGGMVPLGYDTKERKITVNEAEAETVRTIFRRYLDLRSLHLLMADLRRKEIVTKVRKLKTGKAVGGIPFTRGPLAHLLRNRFYIGQVPFKGEILKGEQPAIVECALFDAVQSKLNDQANGPIVRSNGNHALLTGRIFDDRGNRMTPSHARKAGRRYCYYLSAALLQGRRQEAGSVERVSAPQIETAVLKALQEHLETDQLIDRDVVLQHLERVEVQRDQVMLKLVAPGAEGDEDVSNAPTLNIPWRKASMTREREIIVPSDSQHQHVRPIRSETRATLVASIARGRRWLSKLTSDAAASSRAIAEREGCSVRKVNMTISLAFLAPSLVKAAIEGRLPHGIGVTRLTDLPPEWSRQHQMLGLPEA